MQLIKAACEHDWEDATCEVPKTCSKCGATEGGLADHAYGDLIQKVEATEAADGMEAHYVCSVCEKYFDADKKETTAEDLVIEYEAPEELTAEEQLIADFYTNKAWEWVENGTVTKTTVDGSGFELIYFVENWRNRALELGYTSIKFKVSNGYMTEYGGEGHDSGADGTLTLNLEPCAEYYWFATDAGFTNPFNGVGVTFSELQLIKAE